MKRTAAVGALFAVLAAACGGGQPEQTSPPVPATSPPSPAAGTQSPPAGPNLAAVDLRLQQIATLDQPLAMAQAPEDDTLYVAEKTGRVRALRDGRADPQPVLDLSDEISQGGEQGLLGLAFAPNGRFVYVNFTDGNGDSNVVEYAWRDGRVDLGSRRRVLFVDQPFSNHNGGNLAFGPDGYLYVGLGDGGSGGDPFDNAQNLGTLLGKMLRIDPRPQGGQAYGVPSDNPFVGDGEARPEIWAYGLRNPWRYTFDRDTGDLWIGDVGQNAWEEVDFQRGRSNGGENYGWNRLEGRHAFTGEAPPDAVRPIFEYALEGGACAVTGGYVYRGSDIPALRGAYLLGDFCEGRVRALVRRGGGAVGHRFLGPEVENLSSFGEDHAGELYALSLSGPVYRLTG